MKWADVVSFFRCHSAPPARAEAAKHKSRSCSLPCPCCGGQPRGGPGQHSPRQQPPCLARSGGSYPQRARSPWAWPLYPPASQSPRGFTLLTGSSGGLWGTKTVRFLRTFLPLSVGSGFPLLLEPCRPRAGAGAGGSRSEPERAPVKRSRARLSSEQGVCR